MKDGIVDRMRHAAYDAAAEVDRAGDVGLALVVDAALLAAFRSLPDGAILEFPIQMGITLESWAQRSVSNIADEIQGTL